MITSQVNGTGKKSAQILKKQLDRKGKKQCGDFNVKKTEKRTVGRKLPQKPNSVRNSAPHDSLTVKRRREQTVSNIMT